MPAAKTPETMRIWSQAETTPKKHIKQVKLGRQFHAIDAMYCVMKATELFGPVGEGWGYITNVEPLGDRYLMCEVTVWHGNHGQSFGPYVSIVPIHDTRGKLDGDAAKKGITDSLTKCLSHLGIGADVFLGKWDDNRYVMEQQAREAQHIKETYSVQEKASWLKDEEFSDAKAEEAHKAAIDDDL